MRTLIDENGCVVFVRFMRGVKLLTAEKEKGGG
jgi:hypothetical protein